MKYNLDDFPQERVKKFDFSQPLQEAKKKLFLLEYIHMGSIQAMETYRKDPEYSDLFFFGTLPPFFRQPLEKLQEKIVFHTYIHLVAHIYHLSSFNLAKDILEEYGISELTQDTMIQYIKNILKLYPNQEESKKTILEHIQK